MKGSRYNEDDIRALRALIRGRQIGENWKDGIYRLYFVIEIAVHIANGGRVTAEERRSLRNCLESFLQKQPERCPTLEELHQLTFVWFGIQFPPPEEVRQAALCIARGMKGLPACEVLAFPNERSDA